MLGSIYDLSSFSFDFQDQCTYVEMPFGLNDKRRKEKIFKSKRFTTAIRRFCGARIYVRSLFLFFSIFFFIFKTVIRQDGNPRVESAADEYDEIYGRAIL